MDALTALLDGPRAQHAFLLRSVLRPPWALRIEDEAPLTMIAVASGDAWLRLDGATPTHLHAGDVALVRGPRHYTIAHHRTLRPTVLIGVDQQCTTLRGEPLEEMRGLGIRTWGNDRHGPTTLLTGTYPSTSEVGARTLDALPDSVVVRSDDWHSPLVALLAAEIVNDRPGQAAVLDRLLDLVAVAAMRHWAEHVDTAPLWQRAQHDPCVARALELMHNLPAHPWDLQELAREVGLSRAAFARRFNDLVGEPPITYLARWRLALAADLLRSPDATVTAVARTLGYGNPFSFSNAFKRRYGASPSHYRARSGSGMAGSAAPSEALGSSTRPRPAEDRR